MQREISQEGPRAHARDLGQLEPYFGRWVWPLREMEVGDTFTVATKDKPTGAVRSYVAGQQERIGKKFTVVREGDMTRVTCIPYATTPGDRQRWRNVALFSGAPERDSPEDDGLFLGILQPPAEGSTWCWPFNAMEPGQWFLVDKQHKEPEDIRRSAYSLSRPHGLAVSVNVHPLDHPGYVKITAKIPKPTGMEKPISTYGLVRELVSRCYGANLDALQLEQLWQPGSRSSDSFELTVPPAYPYHVFRFGDRLDQTYGIHFAPMGPYIERLPEGWTLYQWLEKMRKDMEEDEEVEVDPFS